MASKMLRDLDTEATYCFPCAHLMDIVNTHSELEQSTEVSKAVCSVCDMPIAALPEPETFGYDVVLEVTVHVEATWPEEAVQLATSSLAKQTGIDEDEWYCPRQPEKTSIDHNDEEV